MYYTDKRDLAFKLNSFAHGNEEYMKITRIEAKVLADALFEELK